MTPLSSADSSTDPWLWERSAGHIARLLGEQDQQQSADVDWRAASARYRNHILADCNTIPVPGPLPPVALDDIYTEPYLVASLSAAGPFRSSVVPHIDAEVELKRELGRTLVQERKIHRLFIEGKPGSGKTTFLKHLAWEAARGTLNRIPILVHLSNWASRDETLLEFIALQFAMRGVPAARSLLLYLLSDTDDALIMFDGLTEVDQRDDVPLRVVQALHDFSSRFHRPQYLITSRPSALLTPTSFFPVELADFDSSQIVTFVRKWFRSEPLQADAFLASLASEQSYLERELARVPYFLTVLCLTFGQESQPGTVSSLVGTFEHRSADGTLDMQPITSKYLTDALATYIRALDGIAQLTDIMLGRPPTPLRIRSIAQLSPVQISLEGISDTLRFLRELFSKRWRHTAEQLAEGQAEEAKAAAKKAAAEGAKAKAEIDTVAAQAESVRADAVLKTEQAIQLRLQNVQTVRQMAREYVAAVRPNLSEQEQEVYVYQLVPWFTTLFNSPICLVEPPTLLPSISDTSAQAAGQPRQQPAAQQGEQLCP